MDLPCVRINMLLAVSPSMGPQRISNGVVPTLINTNENFLRLAANSCESESSNSLSSESTPTTPSDETPVVFSENSAELITNQDVTKTESFIGIEHVSKRESVTKSEIVTKEESVTQIAEKDQSESRCVSKIPSENLNQDESRRNHVTRITDKNIQDGRVCDDKQSSASTNDGLEIIKLARVGNGRARRSLEKLTIIREEVRDEEDSPQSPKSPRWVKLSMSLFSRHVDVLGKLQLRGLNSGSLCGYMPDNVRFVEG